MTRPADRFVRHLCALRPTRARTRTRRPRLVVQSLEDRTTPTLFTVTSLADDGGAGTLRDVIAQANAAGTADDIVFDPILFPAPQTIALQLGALTIDGAGGNLTITGPGTNRLTVDAGLNSQAFVSGAPVLTLANFTVANGFADGTNGGGLFVEALNSAVVDRMFFTGNQATGTGFGAGSGAAIGLAGGTALTVLNSTISGNVTEQNGAGIYFYFDGDLLLVNSTISGNTTSEVNDQKGGEAIYLYGTAYDWEIINSTIANNTSAGSAGAVGAKQSAGNISIINSTVVGNTATGGNGGGLGVISGAATFTVTNSVVSGNTASATGPDIYSAYGVYVNFSALGDPASGFTLTGANNLTGDPTALGIGALGNNGGPTETMGLDPTSVLIDAGDSAAVPGGLTTDGRGAGFSRIFGAAVDIGAFEDQPPGQPFANGTADDVTAPTITPYQFTVTFLDPNGSNNGIVAADVFNDNAVIRVTGPNGFNQLATYVAPPILSNGTPLTATYQITPPGGGWDVSEDGFYFVSVEPSQVRDLDGNFVPDGPVAVFGVFIPQTLVVTNADDSGPGSLRDAMDRAAAIPSDDTINFDPTFFATPQTISLQTELAPLGPTAGALTINGPGMDLLTVQRDPAAGTDFRVLSSYGAALDMSDFTISGGVAAAGGLAAFGTTNIDSMAFTGNTAGGIAGAIFFGSGQTATMSNSVVSGNTAAGVGGGIIVSTYANLTLTDSTVSNNSADGGGGGIFVDFNGSLTVVNSTIADNTAAGPGGGIYAASGASVVLQNSTVSGNTATTNGGGVYFFSGGALRVENSTISGNSTSEPGDTIGGGGIYLFGSFYDTVVLQNTTIVGNTSAGSGGGVMLNFFFGDLQLANSTVTGNTALSTNSYTYQGYTYLYGGGGIFETLPFATITLQNSIVSGNTNANGPDILDSYSYYGVNYGYVYAYGSLIGDPTGFTLTGGTGNLPFGTDPMLGPLQANGGPTLTMVPLAGSPLINAGDNALVDPLVTTDQRGLSRFDPIDGIVDIGAVEAQPATVTIALDAAQPGVTNVADPVVFTVTFSEPVTGVDDSIIDLSGSTIGGTLSATVTAVSETVYTVTVTGATGDGVVEASVLAGTATAGINTSGIPNLPSPAPATVTVDATVPTVTINQGAGQADPVNAGPITFDVVFTEPVFGFDGSDISFAGSTVGGTPSAAVLPSGPSSYTVTVTGMTGAGTVIASIPAAAATDGAGNTSDASTSSDNSVTFDSLAPTVTINQAAGQADPTGQSPFTFDVVFSELVTGFDATDVNLSASTAGGTLVAAVSGTGTTYTVTVTGMTSRGFVVASIPAGAATDAAGNLSAASTSTDNSVEFVNAGSVTLSAATVTTAEGQTLQITASRVGGSEGAVSISVAAVAGTAITGTDFTISPNVIIWADGESQDQFIVIPITNDSLNEGRETFAVNLINPVGGLLLGTTTSTAVTIAPSDGALVNGAAVRPQKPSAVFQDAAGLNGDNVTVTLGGKVGTATVYLTDPDGDGRGPIELIELAGTDPAKSTLTIGVKKQKFGTGDIRTQLAEVTGTGLKSLTATTTDLNGPGINLSGFLGSLKIGNVGGGADITMGAPPVTIKKPTAKITAGIIGDASNITVAGAPLANLTAVSVGNGTITAPSIGVINAKGKPKTKFVAAIPGNFNADVVVSGVGVLPTKMALTKLRAAGAMSGDVTVTGNVGTISVGARGVGDLTGDVTVTGNLNVVSIAGKADGVLIDVSGNIKSATFGSFWNSRLDAGYTGPNNGIGGVFTANSIGTFKVTGKTAGFQASNVLAQTINSVTLASVTPGNAGTLFGVTAERTLKSLVVTSPTQKFKFNPKSPSPQTNAALGDFRANDLNGPLFVSRMSSLSATTEAVESEPAGVETLASESTTTASSNNPYAAPALYNLGTVTATPPMGVRLTNVVGRGAVPAKTVGNLPFTKADLAELSPEERQTLRALRRAARA